MYEWWDDGGSGSKLLKAWSEVDGKVDLPALTIVRVDSFVRCVEGNAINLM